MVQRKPVPKKAKDPFLTPPSKGFPDHDDHGGGRPRNRGGAAMTPTATPPPASVPNYMRATSSSDAKAGRPAPSSASPPRRRPMRVVVTKGRVLFRGASGVGKATCSSTMKESKFPGVLELAPGATDAEGPAAARVCPYTFCSLNGHAHAPAVPLRSFLASRRRLIKTQQSMKLKGVSAFRKSGQRGSEDKNGDATAAVANIAPLMDEAVGDFFVEVYAAPRGEERVSSDMSCSDISVDEMDAMMRRLEYIVFDRRGSGDGETKAKDLGACGDGDGEREGELEEGFDVCRESSSECSGAISGDFAELPWMRYQGYEYDSFDDEDCQEVVDEEQKEEQRAREEEHMADGACITFTEVSEEQKGADEKNHPDGSGDNCERGISEEQEETKDEEGISDVSCKIEIRREQEATVCRVVLQEQETRCEENSQNAGLEEAAAPARQETEQQLADGVCKVEIPDHEQAKMENIPTCSCEGGTSANQGAKDEENIIEEAAHKLEIPEQGPKDAEILNVGSDMEISEEAGPDVGCKEDFSDVTSSLVSEDEVSEFSAIASPDFEFQKQHIEDDGVFEQDENAADDVFKQDDNIADGSNGTHKEMEIGAFKFSYAFEESGIAQESNQDDTVDGIKDAQKELKIITCKLKDASEESGSPQETHQDDYVAFVSGGDLKEPDINTCKLEDVSEESRFAQETDQDDDSAYASEGASEESSIPQETDQDDNTADVNDGAQKESEITTCNSEYASEEPSIAQETNRDDNLADVNDGAQNELENTTCMLEDASEEPGIPQAIDQDDNTADADDGAQKELEITTCNSEDASEESSIAQETDHDGSTADVNDGAQKGLEITTLKLDDASEKSSIPQETDQDDNTADVNGGAQKELEITTGKCENYSEEYGIPRDPDQDDTTAADVNDGAREKLQITTCELDDASEESGLPQEAYQDDNTADVSDGAQNKIASCRLGDACEELGIEETNSDGAQEKLQITTCELDDAFEESGHPQEAYQDDSTADVSDGAQNKIASCRLGDACEELGIEETNNFSPNVQILGHNSLSTSKDHGESWINLPSEDIRVEESSIDDICSAFSGMNIKGDVYHDPTESAICPGNRLIIARRRTPGEEEYIRGFNPRAPNFLPVEPDPDAEKVDLRHQMMDERKNAEEWMIDYALRRALTNLAPARKKKVELLVQAFETVLPQ